MEKRLHPISEFVNRLIEEKGFGDVDTDVLRQIGFDLTERVEERINAIILENLPPEKLEEFSFLLDSADAEHIQAYCRENIVNLVELIADALVRFRDTYLNAS